MLPSIITLRAFQSYGSVNLKTRARRNIREAGIYKRRAQKLSTSFSTFLERLLTLALVALEPSLVNCRMKAQTNQIRSVMSEDCVVLLEEFVQSNLDLAAENKKLRYMDRYMEISSFTLNSAYQNNVMR